MSTTDPKLGSLDSTFGRILREYDTSIPQISTIVAVVFGSFQFDKYFNAGAWTLVAIFCFALVYMYRFQLPKKLSTMTILMFLFIILASIPVAVLFADTGRAQFGTWVETHSRASSAYASCVISLVIACLLTAYRNEQRTRGLTYPRHIEQAIDERLLRCPIYREKVSFDLRVTRSPAETVEMEIELSYTIVNRTREPQQWTMQKTLRNDLSSFLDVKFNNISYDPNDKDHKFGRGIRIPHTLAPGEKGKVYFHVQEIFRANDSDVFTSYLPATSLKLRVSNPYPAIEFDFESLYFRKLSPRQVSPQVHQVEIEHGVLPFEGVRLNWRPKGSSVGNNRPT